ncbi:hypothetical protein CQ10_32700 [Bradyrhizobium valentinum]|nr:hypothetical protein CQ10_32700 [Bradyrhizobium valentinum]
MLWKAVEEKLEKDLVEQGLVPGVRLPNEAELMARFGVSRQTLRQAMANLEQRGLIRIEQGRGTFVHEGVLHYQLSRRTRFVENLNDQSRVPSPLITETALEPAGQIVAEALKISEDAVVHRIQVKARSENVVLALTNSYFPKERFPNFDAVYRDLRSTTSAYKQFGIEDYVRDRTWIGARMPSSEEARILEQPRSQPLLVSRKVDCDMQNVPISYSISLWCADRVEFMIEGRDLG